jgi:diguanylate cyclase (GGDEF)-like protein/PAS domain S-box-containing protein
LSKRADRVEGVDSTQRKSPDAYAPPQAPLSSSAAQPVAAGESEERFRSLLRFSSDWYWEQDENFRFTPNLRGFPERPGIRPDSYVGKTRWEMPCHGVSEAQWQAHRAALLAHRPFYDFEYLRSSADGQFRWVSVSGEPVFDAQGRFRGYRGIGKDITEHKQAQQRQAIEHAVAQILSEAEALSEAIPRIIESVCTVMGWDYGARWQHHAHDQSYSCVELWCREPLGSSAFLAATRAQRISAHGQGLVRRVLASGQPCWIPDLAAEAGLKRAAVALACGLTGAFAFPIATGNQTLGVMEFFARRVWPPDLALTEAARAVGTQIAQFMVRKQAEERYRELVELSPSAILVHCGGRIVFANPATAQLLGAASAVELLGRSVYDFVHLQHRELARERVARIVEQRLSLGAMEMGYVRLDGSTGHMEVSSSYFPYEGQPAVQAIARDVSERKAAEQKILRLSNLYAALSQTDRAITRLSDAQGLFDEVCRVAVQYGGFELAAILMREAHSPWVHPVAAAGAARAYIETARISTDPDRPEGQGVTGTATRSGKPEVCNDVTLDPRMVPWRAALLGAGLRAAASIPLQRRGEVMGTLLVCAAATAYFDAQLVDLLVEMGSNICFALDAIEREAQRREAEERLAQLAQYDVLTGLPNRSLFLDRLHQAMARARRSATMLGLMFFDLDRFKQINDTLGHSTGDKVLQVVAARLKEQLREVDTISRLGGDEFTLIMEGVASSARLLTVAHKVREAVAAPMHIDGRELLVTTSIGITVFPRDGTEVDALLKNADIAMYRAKQAGRNAYQFYRQDMATSGAQRLHLEAGLRQALVRAQLQLHYQPSVAVRGARIVGMEALLRWNGPGGAGGPAEFVPVAEETGLMVDIGRWVLEAACAQGAAWQRQGLGELELSVNVSARQFLHRDLFEVVAAALERSRLPPARLTLEIPESLLMQQALEVTDALARLGGLGVRLAIDDFGTGHSSLTRLKRFPVRAIKIDQSFIATLPADANDAAIVRAIMAMAHSLEIGVCAERMETRAQLEFLQALECDTYQGYLFSRPLPADEFAALVRAQSGDEREKPNS